MTTTLHDLAEARDVLDRWLLEAEGEETPEIAELWDQLDGDIDTKVERWGLWLLEQESTAEQIKAEEARLAGRRKALERAVERGKAELLRQMQRLDRKKVDGLLVSVTVAQNSAPSITTPLKPEELWAVDAARPFVKREEVVRYTLDRERLLAAWKANSRFDAVPTCITIEKGQHLRIK